ncbi:hypothetical protein BGZ72_002949 [Mortierella alpina]|nr:hypothetical protein BGZ72_002949 [Mortierella alpina]
MKAIFWIVAALCTPALVASDCHVRSLDQGVFSTPGAPSESALVASTCLNRDFGYGIFPQPCNCPSGYTIYANSDCGGQSAYFDRGGWTTGQKNWPAKSYRCDATSVAIRCVDRDFGYGTFSRPCECLSGYTVYGNSRCNGQSYHLNRDSGFGRGSFSKPGNCPFGYTIYEHSDCGARSVHFDDGGWTTGPNNWPVLSYKCDAAKVISTKCTNRRFGVGSFPKPSECKGKYTIFESLGCEGQMVQRGNSGWTTRRGDWLVQSFRCDDDCRCER